MQSYALKFIMVGDSNVGKSQLSKRFCKRDFKHDSQSTVGLEFSTKIIPFERCAIKTQIWDTAGQDRFDGMTKAYYRDTVGALLVYDVTNPQSFENLKTKWMNQLKEHGHEKMFLVLVGNKLDKVSSSPSRVPTSEALKFAEENSIDFIEASALTGENVEKAFRRLALSVAKLLPDVAMHLELTGLPEGWLRLLQESPETSSGSSASSANSGNNNNNNNAVASGSTKGNRNSDKSNRNSDKSKNKNSTIQSSTVISYLNYWTGEETAEHPTDCAPSGMAYEVVKRPGSDVAFRDSTISDSKQAGTPENTPPSSGRGSPGDKDRDKAARKSNKVSSDSAPNRHSSNNNSRNNNNAETAGTGCNCVIQ